jgi:hyaluronan synthase
MSLAAPALAPEEPPPINGRSPFTLVESLIVAALVLLGLAVAIVRPLLPIFESPATPAWVHPIERPALLWGGMGFLLLAVRTALWLWYRPFESAAEETAPWLTVIIPAYNEGAMVEKSIESVAAADYPHDRLEVIVIDDGSRDDTWTYIERAAARHPNLVSARRFEHNRGKRAALAEGFRHARGSVVVTIDSDSVIDPETLLAMAGPFRDPRVGAVAGRVDVYNRRTGWLPPMLQVRYTLSFDFLRAVQSTFRTVYCCPGALAAYRTSGVRRVLDRWLSQRFLGVPCTYGEDRSLTNFLLAEGYDSVYQSTAVVYTLVPHTYPRLCRMYLRWERSRVREDIRFFTRILWKRPLPWRAAALLDATLTNLRYPIGYATLALFVILSFYDPTTVLRVLVAIAIVSLAYTLYFLRRERSWCFLYGVLYSYFAFFTLLWILPWAVFTIRSKSWMTR